MVIGPILSESRSDVFCDNENGANFLFKNNGDGTFVDVARRAGGSFVEKLKAEVEILLNTGPSTEFPEVFSKVIVLFSHLIFFALMEKAVQTAGCMAN